MNETKITLRNAGKINPLSAKEYAAAGGYQALKKALKTPETVIDIVKESGLRGCGGAGFPVGIKWGLVKATAGDVKYLVCNADEGEPGTNKDRIIMSNDPFSIIEGMTIAAIAIGIKKGYV